MLMREEEDICRRCSDKGGLLHCLENQRAVLFEAGRLDEAEEVRKQVIWETFE